MSQPYIGRAAEAAARAKHNRIHNVKKTAKKKQAKKAPTKAAQAINEALGALKPAPERTNIPASTEPPYTEEELITAGLPADAESWVEYGPLGGQDEDAIAREVLGMEMGLPDEPVVAQEGPSAPPEEVPAQAVPELPVNAPQAATEAKPKSPVKSCILSLIDALNFLHREGHLRKLPEKDILILKHRIKTARQLIEKL